MKYERMASRPLGFGWSQGLIILIMIALCVVWIVELLKM